MVKAEVSSDPKPRTAGANPTRAAMPSGREFDGTVRFGPSTKVATFRYRISVKDEKVQFWLENVVNKKQWQTDKLGMDEFVKSGAGIPMASFDDYISCFYNCLAATAGDTKQQGDRDLVPHGSDAWELRLTLNLKLFASAWSPTYSFILKEIPLEPLDIVAAKVRDHDEAIDAISEQVTGLSSRVEEYQSSPEWIRAITTQRFKTNQALAWTVEKSSEYGEDVVSVVKGTITLNVAGVFMIAAVIVHDNSNNNVAVQLLHNGTSVVDFMDSNADGYRQATPIYYILAASKSDTLSIVYKGDSSTVAGSYINIAQLR